MNRSVYNKFAIAVAAILATAGAIAAESRISADQAFDRVQKGQLTLIDIRSPQEWRKSGIPKGSKPITMHNPGGRRAFKNEILKAVNGDLNRPIALICAVGGRSHWAQRFLRKQGFTNVQDVSEGLFGRGKDLPGWLKRGLPLTPCAKC
jgi:rhodanese-related sulfurtransferase